MTWINCKAGIENSGSKKECRQWRSLCIAKRQCTLKSRNEYFLLSSAEELSQCKQLPCTSVHERRFVISGKQSWGIGH